MRKFRGDTTVGGSGCIKNSSKVFGGENAKPNIIIIIFISGITKLNFSVP